MTAPAHSTHPVDAVELGDARKRKALLFGVVALVVGLAAGLAGLVAGERVRFAFSYLIGFYWLLTISLGALFWILVWHVTRAGWSVGPRRKMEWLASLMPLCLILFLPIAFYFGHDLYHHWMAPEAQAGDILIKEKSGYLNTTFFYVRAAIYFVAWLVMVWFFVTNSVRQDVDGNPRRTLRMQFFSAPAILVYGLTVSFAAFDWLMSLDPHWYSTIFGVYVFTGGVTASLSALALLHLALRRAGVLRRIETTEHAHDIGKLLHGFVIFWAYIGFSQYFLIWYANIPEETIWFRHRWEHGFKPISVLLLFGHFIVPFLFLLSRHVKRSKVGLTIGAILMLVMHYVDLYWLVMPTLNLDFMGQPPAHPWHGFEWVDVTGFLLAFGLGAVVLAFIAGRTAPWPIKDPRAPEAMRLKNL